MSSNNEKQQWNRMADDFQKVFLQGQAAYNDEVVRFWKQEGLVWPGCRVLDVGCGVGKYGTMLAERGCDVTLTDISPEMLQYASQNMAGYSSPWRVFACDFREVSLEEPVFAGGFDFSISTMSPAVRDVEAIRKLSVLTHGWCFMTHFCEWEQPLRNAVLQEASAAVGYMPGRPDEKNLFTLRRTADRNTGLSEDCERLLQGVKENGYQPHTRVVPYNWSDRRTPEEMAGFLMRRPEFEGCGEKEAETWRTVLVRASEKHCDADGILEDAVYTKVLWIWWESGQRI